MAQNIQWETITALFRAPRKQTKNGMSSNGLHMSSINSRDMQMMIDLWEIKNGEVHGKEAAVKQRKRKAKVAISVRALRELQDQP